jgi:hypothetical protein
MKVIKLLDSEHADYEYVCATAQQVYHDRLSVTIVHFPKLLFGVFDGSSCIAAMGLHAELTADMFKNDLRVRRTIEQQECMRIAEQGIFFTKQCPAAVPLLIATVAEYAHYAGFTHVIYAAIPVSAKTIEHLGYRIQVIGRVDLATFPASERHNYVRWHTEHDPHICLLDTGDAPARTLALPRALTRRLSLECELGEYMSSMRSRSELAVAA